MGESQHRSLLFVWKLQLPALLLGKLTLCRGSKLNSICVSLVVFSFMLVAFYGVYCV